METYEDIRVNHKGIAHRVTMTRQQLESDTITMLNSWHEQFLKDDCTQLLGVEWAAQLMVVPPGLNSYAIYYNRKGKPDVSNKVSCVQTYLIFYDAKDIAKHANLVAHLMNLDPFATTVVLQSDIDDTVNSLSELKGTVAICVVNPFPYHFDADAEFLGAKFSTEVNHLLIWGMK